MQPPCPRRAPHSAATATNNFEGKRALLLAAYDLAFERAAGLHSRVGRPPAARSILPMKRFCSPRCLLLDLINGRVDVRMNARVIKAKQGRLKLVARG